MNLSIKNILITGGSGKIGRATIPELLKAGYKLRAIQLPDEPIDVEGIETITGTLADEQMVEKAIEDMDAVIHLANVKENRELFIDSNIKGTFYLLAASMRCGHIKQFIQAGSDARAGKNPDVITPEESKLAVEVICAAERSAKSGEIIVIE